MKMIALALLALAPAQDEEAKKKRLGELLKQMGDLQQEAEKLLEELTGGDRSKKDAVLMDLMRKNAPKMAGQMESAVKAANERNAAATLKTFASANADFRANDRDNNRLQDFWVGDVSGLYRIQPSEPGFVAIKLIETAAALADARPCVPLAQEGLFAKSKLVAVEFPAAPKAGYRFAAIPKYLDDDGKATPYHSGDGRCVSRFGFCAYPAEYGTSGKFTFLITEGNSVCRKDTGGKPVEVAPADPRAEGWTILD